MAYDASSQSDEETRTGSGVWVWSALALALIVATLGLWARHGSGVFAELLAAGWAACFG